MKKKMALRLVDYQLILRDSVPLQKILLTTAIHAKHMPHSVRIYKR